MRKIEEGDNVVVTGHITSERGAPFVEGLRGVVASLLRDDPSQVKIWPVDSDDPKLPPKNDGKLWFDLSDPKTKIEWVAEEKGRSLKRSGYDLCGEDPYYKRWLDDYLKGFDRPAAGEREHFPTIWSRAEATGYERGLLLGRSEGFALAHSEEIGHLFAAGALRDWVTHYRGRGGPLQMLESPTRITVTSAQGLVVADVVLLQGNGTRARMYCSALRECVAWSDTQGYFQ
jgi:hypothetical protein